LQQGENTMTKLKKVHYKTKAHTAGAFVLLSRFLVALFVATVFLALPTRLLAQQSAQTDAQTQVAGKAIATENNAIRPFRVHVPQEAIVDLRRRIATTRWSDKETVTDQSQGVQLTTMKELVRYWGTKYDWRKAEAKLNALPQFVTNIDGLDIHFIHVRSKNPNALPLLITHGWPGSVLEQLKVIGPLTNPTAYGGRPEDAFDLVIPSIPGFGFSGKPTSIGWNPDRIARAWAELMKHLDYTRYVAQGGDWGSPISSAMARQAPAGLLGIHINLPATILTILPDVAAVLTDGGSAPAGLSEKERAAFDSLDTLKNKRAYAAVMGTQPQVVGYGLTDRTRQSDSRRGCSGIQASRSGRTEAAIPKSLRRKTRCWTTSRCTG
jgi:pimeloyl-ACP methyl ester carboxylesterase